MVKFENERQRSVVRLISKETKKDTKSWEDYLTKISSAYFIHIFLFFFLIRGEKQKQKMT